MNQASCWWLVQILSQQRHPLSLVLAVAAGLGRLHAYSLPISGAADLMSKTPFTDQQLVMLCLQH